MVEFGAETHSSSLFLDDFFAYLRLMSHRPGPKVVRQKKMNTSSSEKIWPIWRSAGTLFRTPKTQIPLAKAFKTSPKTKLRILLTCRLIGTFGSTVVGTLLKLRLRRKYLQTFDSVHEKNDTFWISVSIF